MVQRPRYERKNELGANPRTFGVSSSWDGDFPQHVVHTPCNKGGGREMLRGDRPRDTHSKPIHALKRWYAERSTQRHSSD